ncbi:MAG: hypothetical protein JJU28_09960 [Cyclobacteriaceae bacterium]|nr:hypothetical protein [Cyclobacteriaceae bacterium]
MHTFRALLILSSILICSAQRALAKDNFKPSTLVMYNGDTLYGSINYGNWEKNPGQIRFKADNQNSIISYTPIDVEEFYVEGDMYVSRAIEADFSSLNQKELNYSREFDLKKGRLFLRVLVKGEPALLHHVSQNGRDNFFVDYQGETHWLKYRKYIDYFDKGYTGVAYINTYQGQLKFFLADCPEVANLTSRTAYNQKQIIQLFHKYYACKNPEMLAILDDGKPRSEIGIFIGYGSTHVNYKGKIYRPFTESYNLSFSTLPVVGLSYNVPLRRSLSKFSIFNDLHFSGYTVEGRTVLDDFSFYFLAYDINQSFSYVNLSNLLRYRFFTGKSILFINAGIAQGAMVTLRNEMTEERREASETTHTSMEAISKKDIRKYEQSIVLGAGISRNRLSGELRYQNGSGVSRTNHLGTGTTRLFLLLNYTLIKN